MGDVATEKAQAKAADSGEPSTSSSVPSSETPAPSSKMVQHKKPVVIIVIGMAGSGKTTLMQRLVSHMHSEKKRGYVLNLDPAVMSLPFTANIDIRDTVNYKNVMKEYHLGPNGGILTSLNLFATKFDEVVGLVEARAANLDYVLVDTPGQIEIFTWSASGAIVVEAFASCFPTVVTYVVDTPRSVNPVTFMSNMLYACGILYKTRLPLLLAFNKIDVAQHQFALEWMNDFEAFQNAVEGDTSYSSSLSRSLCLVLDEFYKNLRSAGVSAVTGEGVHDFFNQVDKSADEYTETYLPDLERRKAQKAEAEASRREANLARLRNDLAESQGQNVVLSAPRRMEADDSDDEEEEEVDEEEDEDDDDDGEDDTDGQFFRDIGGRI